MDPDAPSWAPHPDHALEARLVGSDAAALVATLTDPALRNDPYARIRALDRLLAMGTKDPRLLGAWLQAMLLGNRPMRAWRVTGGWPIDAGTPAEAQLLAAQVAQAVGRRDEARNRFHEVLSRHPRWVDALQKYAEFEQRDAFPLRFRQILEDILGSDAAAYEREKAGFALSRVVTAVDPQRAFALAAEAQALKRRRLGPWDAGALAARLARDARHVPLPQAGEAREVFVVGLPRSGTTLLASLLGAHPSIANVGEQGLLPELAAHLATARAPASGPGVDAPAWYRAAVADLAGDAPVVVDKLPSNAEHAGLALSRLPRALVLHLERDLDDCATSIHMHDFETGNAHAADGADIGRYARAIGSHLRDLRERAGGRIVHMRFEDLARDPEACLRPLLACLGLEWDASITGFWRHGVQTATYSEGQVREPVHTRSIGSASRFQPASAGFLAAVRDGAEWHHPESDPLSRTT